jgi:hypothetical protein
VHVLSQQKPSTQWPIAHSVSLSQVAALARFNSQVFAAVQYAAASQSMSVAQAVVQPLPEHAYGVQAEELCAQMPAPLQRNPETCPLVHVVPPQDTLDLANARHSPVPSQVPSALQLIGYAGSTGQSS